MTTGTDRDGGVAAETRYIWQLVRGLMAAKTAEEVSEYKEALGFASELTDFPAIRVMALKVLARDEQPVADEHVVRSLFQPVVRPAEVACE